jgi:3-mercaptopyruvate sulfurtransferase SseA
MRLPCLPASAKVEARPPEYLTRRTPLHVDELGHIADAMHLPVGDIVDEALLMK